MAIHAINKVNSYLLLLLLFSLFLWCDNELIFSLLFVAVFLGKPDHGDIWGSVSLCAAPTRSQGVCYGGAVLLSAAGHPGMLLMGRGRAGEGWMRFLKYNICLKLDLDSTLNTPKIQKY